METVSIRELHLATGRYVRKTRTQALVVTERGRPVAVLKPFTADDLPGRAFPKRRAKDLPRAGHDSTRSISDDRDGR